MSVTTLPLTMISVTDVPAWDAGKPQEIPLDLSYENGARLNKITVSGCDVTGAGGTWIFDSLKEYKQVMKLSKELRKAYISLYRQKTDEQLY